MVLMYCVSIFDFPMYFILGTSVLVCEQEGVMYSHPRPVATSTPHP